MCGLVFTCWVLFLLLTCFQYGAATTALTSTLDGRQTACPGEVVTYTCTVTQVVLLDWTAEPFINETNRLQFSRSTPAEDRVIDCSDSSTVPCADLDYRATLTSVGPAQDITSTFRFTASARVNGTVVQCIGSTGTGVQTANSTLNVTDLPSPPRTPSYFVQQYSRDSVILTVQWQPPQYDGGAPVNYTITVSPGLSPVTTSGTSVSVTVPYNVIHTVSIVAANCNGSSSAAMETIPAIVNCSDPTLPTDGSIDPYQNTTEGAEIFFRCNTSFVPTGRITATCASNGMWTPDPADLTCTFNCSAPGPPQRGSLESYTNTTEGSVVFYSCDQHQVPEGRMRANCTRNGWSPNPADLNCAVVDCGMPRASENGFIENIQSISTVGGAQIFFRCNSGFVPAGRMSATCRSPDGVSVLGTWTPDPAHLVCNASTIVCEDPTPPSGVTVVQPHTNTVSSVIIYQCQQSGFAPSPPSSVCVDSGTDNGIWSPDPSQVVCSVIPTTSMPSMSPTTTTVTTGPTVDTGGLGGGAVAGIVIVLLLVIALCVAVVIVLGIIWWRKRSDVSSKPPTQDDDYEMVGGPEKPAPYKGYMDQGPGTEAEYTVVSDIPAPSKPAEPHYDLPPGSNHPEGLVYASVEIKPKKPSAPPKPVKEDDRVEYAAIAYQPKDAAKSSQAAAATAPKTKRYPDADELVNLDNLLIQLRDVTPMWFDLGDALDLPPSILDDIRGQFETNPQQCMIEMVDAWLQRHLNRGSPTWTEVAEALRKINQNGLANALENVYYTDHSQILSAVENNQEKPGIIAMSRTGNGGLGDLPISVDMNEIPAFPADNDGSPPPIPIRGTLTDDVEPAPPKPPKSWGTPEKKALPQRPPRGGSGRRPPPRPPKPSAP